MSQNAIQKRTYFLRKDSNLAKHRGNMMLSAIFLKLTDTESIMPLFLYFGIVATIIFLLIFFSWGTILENTGQSQ